MKPSYAQESNFKTWRQLKEREKKTKTQVLNLTKKLYSCERQLQGERAKKQKSRKK